MKKNKNKYDFSAVATKAGVKCSDGRTISKTAFAHMDGKQVPLLWQHLVSSPSNILGKALLEHDSKTGITMAHCTFNNSPEAKAAKERLAHGDIDSVSIRANELEETASKLVKHGMIRELSLVVSGANSEAKITQLYFEHSDEPMDEFLYCSGVEIVHEDSTQETEESEDGIEHSDATIAEIIASMSEEQQEVMYALIGMAAGDMSQSAIKDDNKGDGKEMKHNIFDKGKTTSDTNSTELTHESKMELFGKVIEDTKAGKGFDKSLMVHALDYGISNIDLLFPDYTLVRNTPDIVGRDQNWVEPFLNRCHKSPFARFRSRYADLREDEARAKGYITGNRKIEQVFAVAQRQTGPTTVYKKQKLDNDNIVDITDFDVVSFIKAEMRPMLREEIARAILVGDGRTFGDPDKIKEENVRPIWTDDEFYSHKIKLDAGITQTEIIDAIFTARNEYKGTGAYPVLYTTKAFVTKCRIIRDAMGRNIYRNMTDLEDALGVSAIVEVEVMEGLQRNDGTEDVNLIGIMCNMSDYTIGMDRGGQIGSHEFFDIDYNQHKFLLETRMSGALTKWKSAVVIEQALV